MNSDLSIHRMAFREADLLGVAQALVVKKRQELELRLLRERVLQGASAAGAGIDAALRRMDDVSNAKVQAGEDGVGVLIDKSA